MSRLRRIFAGLALALVLAPLLASAPLFDPDEGLHAAIAQEMVQRGDYVTPAFRGVHEKARRALQFAVRQSSAIDAL